MRRVLLAVMVAAGAVGVLAQEANAFHHKIHTRCIAYYPGLYSFGYCGAPCPPPPYTFPCTYSYPKYCGPFASCYDGRVLCSTGKHHGCFARHAAKHAAKRFYSGCGYGCGLGYGYGGCGLRGCAPCGYGCRYACGGCGDCGSCGDGCNSGSCGGCATGGGCAIGGGCQNWETGSSAGVTEGGQSYNADEKVLYDGPADKAPSTTPPPTPEPDPSASIFRRPFRLTSVASQQQGDGSKDFALGLRAYLDNNMNGALEAFEASVAAEPQNALYAYYRALAMYNLQGAEGANDSLAQAVELERQTPIAQWGKRMERIQGRARIWIEQARVAGGIGR